MRSRARCGSVYARQPRDECRRALNSASRRGSPSSGTSRCVSDAVGPSLESDRGEMAVRRQRNGAGRERREPARRASPRSKELVDQREVIRVARSARTMGKISSAKYESSC